MPDGKIAQELLEAWKVLQQLPSSAVIALLALLGAWTFAIYKFVALLFRNQLSTKDATIQQKDAHIAHYKDLGTPNEIKARIDRLEGTLRRTVGEEWGSLTEAEIAALSEALSGWSVPRPSQVTILYKDHLGENIAQSLAAAFVRVGFAAVARVGAVEEGLTIGPYPEASKKIKAALEAATKLRVRRIFSNPNITSDYSADPGSHKNYVISIRFGTNVADHRS
jgi:hypothetical protein